MNKMSTNFILMTFIIASMSLNSNCKKQKPKNDPVVQTGPSVSYWLTKGDQSALLQKQTAPLVFSAASNSYPVIEVDSAQQFQTIDGFGFTLTGGSAYHLNKLNSTERATLLQELFGNNENSISISYLRLSIGASDLNASVFSYNDLPTGQTDVNLTNFSLSQDTVDLIPVLKEILAINPNIKILGSPWSPPVWMKDNGNSIGGSLLPQYYDVYARYFVKYIQAMKLKGITVDAITIQNEPLHPGNNPSMYMPATQQANFIKNNLGPAFQTAGITTKIIIYDHNCNKPEYPIAILNDPEAKKYIDGSAFHLYEGDISALSSVQMLHPDKNLYFTEQWTGAKGTFNGDLQWHIKNVIIGSMRNWSKVALEWNLANDGGYNPHTPGGCTECKGAITFDGVTNRNVAYYIIAHASKFVPPGSVRIASNQAGSIYNVAFITASGKKILIALNDGTASANFNIKYKGMIAAASLPAGAVATYVW
jgi:glucosylceramidase